MPSTRPSVDESDAALSRSTLGAGSRDSDRRHDDHLRPHLSPPGRPGAVDRRPERDAGDGRVDPPSARPGPANPGAVPALPGQPGPPEGVRALPGQVLQQGERRRVLAFEEETLRGLTPPGVGVGQQGHELGGRRPAQGRLGALLEAVGDEVVEPPAVLPARQVEVLLDRLGDRGRVLDRLAVHVQDQERAVGGVGEVDGPEPVVRRGQELDLLVGPRREELGAVLGRGSCDGRGCPPRRR